MNDEQLVAAILAGHQDEFKQLVERYQGRLVNYLYRMLRNVDEAHDLAQDVFIKVYQALDSFNPRYRFSTWLFRVAKNAAIDHLRKKRMKLVSLNRQDPDSGEPQDWDLPSPDRGPYGELRNLERGDAIQEAIEGLPWEYRELILMRHYGELSYDEIATLKEMPLGTVKNKLFRGRQMLKQKLASYLTD
ncbi:MAG: sigma-70 family RNA polymerase sigma factor [Acidobacteriota bacterium]|nr:sigma-70 family RNA polymerase sigma factor [Acidobacteriota bacterium]